MDLLEEIREYFAARQDGIRSIKNIPSEYPAYTWRDNGEYGVAIPFDSDKDVSESSTNARICTREMPFGGTSGKYLMLVCYDEMFRNEFATFCKSFVNPGYKGQDRKNLIDNPLAWWKRWIGLLGNREFEKKPYSIIAEMEALDVLFQDDKTIVWSAAHAGSHDIESDSNSFEVKSTVKKSDLSVTISSQHQLKSDKPLELYFCRLELSGQGVSINSLREKLIKDGYDEVTLDHQLDSFGYEKGASIRDVKYNILEKRKYKVDDKFPKITENSFKDDIFPPAITKIIYTIDLSNIAYEAW